MKTIVFDFDGVIHKYSEGWKDGSIYDKPDMIVVGAIKELMKSGEYSICIISTREPDQIVSWIQHNDLFPCAVVPDDNKFWQNTSTVGVTNRKLPAVIYIDDRAFRYNSAAYETSGNLLSALSFQLNK